MGNETSPITTRSRPLAERKNQLFKFIRRADGIEYVEHLAGRGPEIFEHACGLGYEGIVSKRIDLAYRSGPTKIWLKTKNKDHPAMQRVREAFERERELRSQRDFRSRSGPLAR